MNTGVVIPGKPSMGAWVTYGLGTENQNLPAFVVLPDFRSLPFSGSQQWGPGFLPASYQGTVLRWKGDPILDLKPPADVTAASAGESRWSLLRSYNQEFLARHFTNPDLQGRMDSYELAYRMQAEVPGVLDIAGEPEATREMYGTERSGDGVFRQALSDGAEAGGEGRAVRAALYARASPGTGTRRSSRTTRRTPPRPTSRSRRCSRI